MAEKGSSVQKNDQSFRKVKIVELSVFLFLIVPSMAFSFFVVKMGAVSFILTAFSTIFRDLSLVFLILFFLWRNAEPLKSIGLKCDNIYKEIWIAFLLFLPFFYFTYFLSGLLESIGLHGSKTPVPKFLDITDWGQFALGIILVIIVAISEEIIFRGYLMLRLKTFVRDNYVVAFLSAAIFSIGHGYEGTAGVITVGWVGLFFSFVYLWRKNLVVPVVLHFLFDSVGILLLPLLKLR